MNKNNYLNIFIYFLLILFILFILFILYNKNIYESFSVNNLNKCAIIIPIHPPKYNYGYEILNFLNEQQTEPDTDFYFIFSNINDKNIFSKNLKNDKYFKYILLSDFTLISDFTQEHNSGHIVNIKKLYAISILYKKYDFISAMDSEIKLKNNKFYDGMKDITNKKIVIGGDTLSTETHNIIKDSLYLTEETNYHDKLKELSNNFQIYTWWNLLPVINCNNVEHFLTWINFKKDNLQKFEKGFDHIAYDYFCILFYNYKLILIPGIKVSLENADTSIYEYIDKNVCKLYWVAHNAYIQNPKYYDDNNFLIIYHMDRI